MKRFIMIMLASFMTVGLVGCGEDSAQKQEEERAQSAVEQSKEQMNNGSDASTVKDAGKVDADMNGTANGTTNGAMKADDSKKDAESSY